MCIRDRSNWVETFRTIALTQEIIGGSVKTVCMSENVERVAAAVTRSLKRSSRKHAVELEISNRSLRRILQQDLHYHILYTKFMGPKNRLKVITLKAFIFVMTYWSSKIKNKLP